MLKLKKTSVALAAAGLLVAVASGSAQAYVMASATVELQNFQLKYNVGGAVLDAGDFSFLTYTSTGAYSGTLPGTPGYNQASTATPVNLPAVCVGSGCGALALVNDTFPHLAAAPVGNYSAADQFESGAPITGLPGLPLGADIKDAAYAGLTTQSALSHSQSTNNLNTSFRFALTKGGAIDLSFAAKAYLQVAVSAGEHSPGFATAAYEQAFSLTDLTTGLTIFNYSPDFLGGNTKTLSLNAPLPIDIELQRENLAFINYLATTPVLTAGKLYQLSARTNTNADVQRVPEPGTLALLGLGFLGFCFSAKKRSSKSPQA
jgi:hypothetical protein